MISLPQYLLSPDPFSYFRPIPKLFFLFMWNVFNDNYSAYRVVIILLHILIVILIYKLTLNLKYNPSVAFTAALLFSVLTSHTEALYFINCMNEIFSAFFILLGLYLFSKNKDLNPVRSFFIIIIFLSALFSRESAVCYIPLILLLNFAKVKQKWNTVFFILIMPILIYTLLRFCSEMLYANSNLGTTISSMDLNPVKISYKMVHYFIMMLFPVKIIFEFIGFESLEFLINIYRKPMENFLSFALFSFLLLTVFTIFIYHTLKILRKKIIFPLLFTLSSLFIYLFSFSTAERYSYLPSAGVCILIGIFFYKLNYSKIFQILLILFISAHLFSLVQRSYRYKQAADFSHQSIKNLYEVTGSIENESDILMLSLPPKKYGIYFLNVPNFYYNWKYNYPLKKYNFIFDESNDFDKMDAVLKFSEDKSIFEKIK